MESTEREVSPCLYVSSKEAETSTVILKEKLQSLGFKVHSESSIATATKLCSTTKLDLIVLEDCEEKAFVQTIKTPNAYNEHTPVVYISSGPLSGIVRDFMQDQYIDELVFKCLTLEDDLGRAVARLKTQPGQFAITPKLKRSVRPRKRTLETALPSPKRKQTGTTVVSPAPHGLDYAQINSVMAAPLGKQQQDCFQHENDPNLQVGRIHCNDIIQPCPGLSVLTHVENSKGFKTEGCVERMHFSNIMLENPPQPSAHQWLSSITLKSEGITPPLNNKGYVQDGAKEATASNDVKKNTGRVAKRKRKENMSAPMKPGDEQDSSPSLERKTDTPGQTKPRQKSTLYTAGKTVERKELHLDKEKRRRERITKSWHCLRQLIPNCDAYEDKATVFEMSVAYLHHCWKYHGPIIQQVNKEFLFLNTDNISLEDLERNVIEILEKERIAFGKNVESESCKE